MITKFQYFLYEARFGQDSGRTVPITEEEFLERVSVHCKDYNPEAKLYRNFDFDDRYGFIDPKNSPPRRSIEDENVHVEVMSTSSSWNGWPRYNRSVIGSTEIAAGYASKKFQVIPYDGATLVLCRARHIWASVKPDIRNMDTLVRRALKNNDKSWSDGQVLETLRELGKSAVFPDSSGFTIHMSDVFDIEYLVDDLTMGHNQLYDKFLTEQIKTCIDDDVLTCAALADLLDFAFSPEYNNFAKVEYKDYAGGSGNRQFWTDSPCLYRRLSDEEVDAQ